MRLRNVKTQYAWNFSNEFVEVCNDSSQAPCKGSIATMDCWPANNRRIPRALSDKVIKAWPYGLSQLGLRNAVRLVDGPLYAGFEDPRLFIVSIGPLIFVELDGGEGQGEINRYLRSFSKPIEADVQMLPIDKLDLVFVSRIVVFPSDVEICANNPGVRSASPEKGITARLITFITPIKIEDALHRLSAKNFISGDAVERPLVIVSAKEATSMPSTNAPTTRP